MKRYELLGLKYKQEDAERAVASDQRRFKGVGNYPESCNHTFSRGSDMNRVISSCVLTHLQYDVEVPELRSFIEAGSAVAVDYFYGDYQKIDVYGEQMSKSSDRLHWVVEFRSGLLMAAFVNDVDSRAKLTEWVSPDAPFDPTFEERPESYSWYHLALMRFLRNEPFDEFTDQIRAARPKYPKLLLDWLLAIGDADQKAVDRAAHQCMKYFLKKGLDTIGIETFQCTDASILTMLAAERGLERSTLEEREDAAIMTAETLSIG